MSAATHVHPDSCPRLLAKAERAEALARDWQAIAESRARELGEARSEYSALTERLVRLERSLAELVEVREQRDSLAAAAVLTMSECLTCAGEPDMDGHDVACRECAHLRDALPDWKSRAAELRAKEASRDRFVEPALDRLKQVERAVLEPPTPCQSATEFRTASGAEQSACMHEAGHAGAHQAWLHAGVIGNWVEDVPDAAPARPTAALSEVERKALEGKLQAAWQIGGWPGLTRAAAAIFAARPTAPDPAGLVERRAAEECLRIIKARGDEGRDYTEIAAAIREQFALSGRAGQP